MARGQEALDKVVQVSTSSSGPWNDIPATDVSLSREGDMLDDTDLLSSGYRTRILGLKDWNLSGTLNFSTLAGYMTIRDAFDNRDRVWMRYLPGGSSLSSMGYMGSGVVENDNLSGGVGDLEQSDFSVQADGALEGTSSTITT